MCMQKRLEQIGKLHIEILNFCYTDDWLVIPGLVKSGFLTLIHNFTKDHLNRFMSISKHIILYTFFVGLEKNAQHQKWLGYDDLICPNNFKKFNFWQANIFQSMLQTIRLPYSKILEQIRQTAKIPYCRPPLHPPPQKNYLWQYKLHPRFENYKFFFINFSY